MVVDEAAIEDQAAVRLERAGDHVGGVGVGAVVGGGADAAFGIGLHDDAAEVGDGGVEFVESGFPPGGDAWVERIEGVEAADGLWAAEVDGDHGLHAPGAKGVGDRAICGMNSGVRMRRSALTLLMEQPLMPSEASRRP